ncbi:hypothetical protein H2198_009970, partial [Neophaeococcomyces mojaviensis]
MDVDGKLDAPNRSTLSETPLSEWEKYKQFIHDLYVSQRVSLKEVQKQLAQDYGFRVS